MYGGTGKGSDYVYANVLRLRRDRTAVDILKVLINRIDDAAEITVAHTEKRLWSGDDSQVISTSSCVVSNDFGECLNCPFRSKWLTSRDRLSRNLS